MTISWSLLSSSSSSISSGGEETKELTDEQKKKLIDKLSQKTGKEINLEIKIDKNILGGGVIRIGDKIIDGSIRRELDNWKRN